MRRRDAFFSFTRAGSKDMFCSFSAAMLLRLRLVRYRHATPLIFADE